MSNVVAWLRRLDINFVTIFVAVLDLTAYGIQTKCGITKFGDFHSGASCICRKYYYIWVMHYILNELSPSVG